MTATKTEEESPEYTNVLLRGLAKIISYLLHPIFLPLYVVYFLLFIHPKAFVGFSVLQKYQTLVIICLNLIFFPLMSVFLLKAVGFINSIFLKTQKDRIIPYIACGIFFFWTYTVFKEQDQYPRILVSFILGIFLSSSAALLANIYFKVSIHAIGMGGWLGIFLIMFYHGTMLMSWPLAMVLILTGMVCTSRLILNEHRPFDIYAGLFIGLVCQLLAVNFVGG